MSRMNIDTYSYIYVHIYIFRERERERERSDKCDNVVPESIAPVYTTTYILK